MEVKPEVRGNKKKKKKKENSLLKVKSNLMEMIFNSFPLSMTLGFPIFSTIFLALGFHLRRKKCNQKTQQGQRDLVDMQPS